MEKKLTVKEFKAKTLAEQHDYIRERLNLDFYGSLDPDYPVREAEKGKRFIGFVLTSNQNEYSIYPIDCLDTELTLDHARALLFENDTTGLVLADHGSKSLEAVKSACERTMQVDKDNYWREGQYMISGEYVLLSNKGGCGLGVSKIRNLNRPRRWKRNSSSGT